MNNKGKIAGRLRPRPNKDNVSYYDIILELGRDPITQKGRQMTYRVNTTDYEEANRQLLLKQAELIQGDLLEPSKITVEEFLRENYDLHINIKKKSVTTKKDYLFVIDHYLVPAFGKIKLQDLNHKIIQRTYNQWEIESPKGNKPLATETIKHINRVFKAALNKACRLGYIKENPTLGLDFGNAPKRKEQDVFTVEEIQQLQRAVKGTDMELPIALLFDCVMRRGELLGLRYGDIDFDAGIVHIRNSWVESPTEKAAFRDDVKSENSNRSIVVTKRTLELLRKQRIVHMGRCLKYGKKFDDTHHVICKENCEPFLPHSFTQKWSRTLKKYGIRHLKLHATRHSAISMLLSEGVPLHIVRDRAGHKSSEITLSVYSHVAKDKQTVATKTLEHLLIS